MAGPICNRTEGAAPLAALIAERDAMRGHKVAVILCGQNIDRDGLATIPAGNTPHPARGHGLPLHCS